uniref:Uncharacterized protein n=1 Tax=Cyprinus carpio TaxID=7962 RepID=A0A8C2FKT0_CYPCA
MTKMMQNLLIKLKITNFLLGFGYLPSASVTRLARSRTANNSSLERNRNRSGTNTEEQRGRSHTDVSLKSSAGAEHSSSALTHSVELSCLTPRENNTTVQIRTELLDLK